MKLYKNLSLALKEKDEVFAIKLTLKGSFPKDLYHLPHLTELYLEGSCKEFYFEKHHWLKLKTLSIKWEDFSGDLSGIFTLPSLENLKINDTPLRKIIFPLGSIQAPLKLLTIKNCHLESLPEEISMMDSLQELFVPGNKLKELPQSFYGLANLKRLNIDGNQFATFPNVIKKMPYLKSVSADHNLFNEDEKARIQREFNLTVE
jgi:Leucine-rich repeat (LRR) protein